MYDDQQARPVYPIHQGIGHAPDGRLYTMGSTLQKLGLLTVTFNGKDKRRVPGELGVS